ncbi:MAG: glycine/sarcosine/betaine reductase component B subunit [Lachnospiraceae bacterium]|nr:glycine/sarcosine/betaine reductase component B subunit [Lachnospiraceae bacterium]
MKLEIGNFHVKDIVFGDALSYKDGILTINKEEALDFIRQDARITEADLYIVKPGEMVRLCPVKEAIEPRCRLDGQGLFPAYTSGLRQAGEGVLHALKECSVIVVGRHMGGFQDGIIDMGGPGQKHTYFGNLINIVLVGDTNEDFERFEQQKMNDALRRAGHKLAEFIGQCVKDLEPEDTDVYETTPIVKRSPEKNALPGVVAVIQPQSQMETLGYNTLYYGWDMNRFVPTYINAQEVLDGCLVSGSFMPTSSKWSTYDFQNFPILRRLMEEDGKDYNFLGVILANLNVAMDQKERCAQILTQIALELGADFALVTEEGYGNPDADYVLAISNLEKAGIKVVAVANESTGRDGGGSPLVTLDERIVAMVSTGNVGELIELPPMPVVLGELEALGRDGNSGGWDYDEVLGPSVRPDGSIIMEDNGLFCGDQTVGWSLKTMKDF